MTGMGEPRFHVALVHPEIPQNTGNVGRLCVGLGARLHLVHPLGFRTDEKAVRRAGIDHWKQVDLQEWTSLDAFLQWIRGRRVHILSRHAERPVSMATFHPGDVLIFGRESTGLPPLLKDRQPAWRIPIPGPIRSLNLANAVAVVAYEALRQLEPELFPSAGPDSSGIP
jgi:tRNA (cytidine/uridine-2'-O-)-methyltransferase